jgi:hypothetical protein
MKTLFIIGFILILSFIILLSYFIPPENENQANIHNRFSIHNIKAAVGMIWQKILNNFMKSTIPILLLLAVMLIASCTSTKITTSWRLPNKQISISKLNKVLVVALFKTETSRHKAEDQMVSYLKGKGIASYDYLNANFNKKSESEIQNKVKLGNFDGAVTMRLIDISKEENYVPSNIATYPDYYGSFSGYYHRNWSYYNDPGYYYTTKKYIVETNIYSLKEDRIIWSGITKTTDPKGVDKMMNEITRAVYKKMIKEGFIKK